MFGFLAYTTYDVTNLATLRNWPLATSIVVVAWGTTLTAISVIDGYSAASFYLSQSV